MKYLAEKLKGKNLKVTPQRLAVYHMLSQTKEHPSAETIYQQLEPLYPALSLATVYKTLDTFTKSGLIQEINVGEGSFRYDANCHPHSHFICNSCNKVLDIEPFPQMAQLKDKVTQSTGCLVEQQQFFFFGKCNQCANLQQTSTL